VLLYATYNHCNIYTSVYTYNCHFTLPTVFLRVAVEKRINQENGVCLLLQNAYYHNIYNNRTYNSKYNI